MTVTTIPRQRPSKNDLTVEDILNGAGPMVAAMPLRPSALYGKALYRITEAMELLGMSRTVIYEQMRAKRLRFVMQGTDRRITAAAIDDYVMLLEHETARGNR